MRDLLGNNFDIFTFFEVTPDLVCIAGRDGFFKKINQTVIDKLGYTESELFARPISDFIFPEDRELTAGLREQLLKGKVLHNFINRYVKKDGDIVWLEWTSIYFSDKDTVFAIAKDITERKQMEEFVAEQYHKYKSLTTYFKSNIEKQRKYLSYELHEELAQLVAGLKIDIEWVAASQPGMTETSKSRIEHAMAVSKLLIKTLQRLSFSISPNMMDEFGLTATLEWLCKEFSILNNIPCSFESSYDEESLTQEVKIDFFRICQEALTNVIDHSQADNVKVSILDLGDKLQLSIYDNGKGFNMSQQKETPGLTSMQVRADSINGKLDIETGTGKGTLIQVSIAKHAIHQN